MRSPSGDLLYYIWVTVGFGLIEVLVCRKLSSIRLVPQENHVCVNALKTIRKIHKKLACSSGLKNVIIKPSLKAVHIGFYLTQ